MQTAENYTKTARKPLIFSGFRRIYKLRFLWLGYSFMTSSMIHPCAKKNKIKQSSILGKDAPYWARSLSVGGMYFLELSAHDVHAVCCQRPCKAYPFPKMEENNQNILLCGVSFPDFGCRDFACETNLSLLPLLKKLSIAPLGLFSWPLPIIVIFRKLYDTIDVGGINAL